jgi:hypothetical protein
MPPLRPALLVHVSTAEKGRTETRERTCVVVKTRVHHMSFVLDDDPDDDFDDTDDADSFYDETHEDEDEADDEDEEDDFEDEDEESWQVSERRRFP